jgi:hypothetical protein
MHHITVKTTKFHLLLPQGLVSWTRPHFLSE